MSLKGLLQRCVPKNIIRVLDVLKSEKKDVFLRKIPKKGHWVHFWWEMLGSVESNLHNYLLEELSCESYLSPTPIPSL